MNLWPVIVIFHVLDPISSPVFHLVIIPNLHFISASAPILLPHLYSPLVLEIWHFSREESAGSLPQNVTATASNKYDILQGQPNICFSPSSSPTTSHHPSLITFTKVNIDDALKAELGALLCQNWLEPIGTPVNKTYESLLTDFFKYVTILSCKHRNHFKEDSTILEDVELCLWMNRAGLYWKLMWNGPPHDWDDKQYWLNEEVGKTACLSSSVLKSSCQTNKTGNRTGLPMVATTYQFLVFKFSAAHSLACSSGLPHAIVIYMMTAKIQMKQGKLNVKLKGKEQAIMLPLVTRDLQSPCDVLCSNIGVFARCVVDVNSVLDEHPSMVHLSKSGMTQMPSIGRTGLISRGFGRWASNPHRVLETLALDGSHLLEVPLDLCCLWWWPCACSHEIVTAQSRHTVRLNIRLYFTFTHNVSGEAWSGWLLRVGPLVNMSCGDGEMLEEAFCLFRSVGELCELLCQLQIPRFYIPEIREEERVEVQTLQAATEHESEICRCRTKSAEGQSLKL
ncbi:hypothetical protein DEU56DRAFT_754938 [Suillus clintonianus]|uniref:uncharacterized protein n=1 Tax=Suillus clintonianus TaxID=1904413 RepID=UPI001B867E29|nr:uncharacterized protein DEU56DRAFT_754938 [Suillus clintonianus]KAG2141215.1 hypothetical protein DEU56DRAFT_754938 [Suillus clintonianus]